MHCLIPTLYVSSSLPSTCRHDIQLSFYQIDRLLADRLRAKLAGDFTGADVLRQELADEVCS